MRAAILIAALGAGLLLSTQDTAHAMPWCGAYLSKHIYGHSIRNLWLARNWASVGQPSGPCVGCIVVWRHHVGQIVGHTAGGEYIVHSGNDGGRVRTRARSISNAIAFRRI